MIKMHGSMFKEKDFKKVRNKIGYNVLMTM